MALAIMVMAKKNALNCLFYTSTLLHVQFHNMWYMCTEFVLYTANIYVGQGDSTSNSNISLARENKF